MSATLKSLIAASISEADLQVLFEVKLLHLETVKTRVSYLSAKKLPARE